MGPESNSLEKKLRQACWNAKCINRLVCAQATCMQDAEARQQSYRDLATPDGATQFDIVAKVRSRRLRWLGHLLRAPAERLPRRVTLAVYEKGVELFRDAQNTQIQRTWPGWLGITEQKRGSSWR